MARLSTKTWHYFYNDIVSCSSMLLRLFVSGYYPSQYTILLVRYAHKTSPPRRSIVATCCPLEPPRPQSSPQIPVCTKESLFVCVGLLETLLKVHDSTFQTSRIPVVLQPAATYFPFGLHTALDQVWTVLISASRKVSTAAPFLRSIMRSVESMAFVNTLVASTGENCTEVMPPSCRSDGAKQDREHVS